MVLRMPCPTKRKGSDNWYYRRTIPADVQRLLTKLPKQQRPRGWYKTHIAISLGTSDARAAKAKCPVVAAEVEQQLTALRKGPKALAPKQIAALGGKLYKAFTVNLEDDPVLSSDQWLRVASANVAARQGDFTSSLTIPLDQEPVRCSLERRFGAMADALLLSEGIVTNGESRRKLIETLARDLTKAAEKLARNADGDYSPDTYVGRFPDVVTRCEVAGANRTSSLSEFIEAWHTSALDRGMRPRSAKQWRSVLRRFKDWLGHDDLRRIALRDVQTWGNERNAHGIKAKTINDTYFAALKAVFDWGRRAGWTESNPAAEARIDGRGKVVSRDRFFSEQEVTALLRATQAVEGTSREHPATTAAKRWVPWLLAYSGARVSELIQLRKQDIRKEGDTWVMRLTPDAGAIKTNIFRDVPLHDHLIELGFIDFLSQQSNGPLFCKPDAKGNIGGSAEGVYSRIRKSVRKVVPDPAVQPNHAWRYTFKSRGFEAGIEAHTLDAICGHGPKSQGEAYTKVTLKKRIEAMRRFPRYVTAQ